MKDNYKKPLPIPQPESDKFWNGLKKKEIWIQRCSSTNQFQFYPRTHCMLHNQNDIEWVKVSGDSTLFTYAIVYQAPMHSFVDDVPYVNALVKLNEGPIIPSNIVDVEPDPSNFKIGMKLKPVFVNVNKNFTLLKFRPA